MLSATYSIRDICQRYGVSKTTVLSWIRNGELPAVNVGRTPNGKKPRWRISEQALAEFEALRTATAAVPRAGKRRPRDQENGVIEFYK